MEQTQLKPHNLTVENRVNSLFTGISDVASFNSGEVKMILADGTRLTVTGEKLQITGFDKRTGEIRLAGRVNSLKYADKSIPTVKRFFR